MPNNLTLATLDAISREELEQVIAASRASLGKQGKERYDLEQSYRALAADMGEDLATYALALLDELEAARKVIMTAADFRGGGPATEAARYYLAKYGKPSKETVQPRKPSV